METGNLESVIKDVLVEWLDSDEFIFYKWSSFGMLNWDAYWPSFEHTYQNILATFLYFIVY